MSKSLDKVLQADGSYKWELVEISEASQVAAAEAAKKTVDANSTSAAPGRRCAARGERTRQAKSKQGKL